MRQALQMAADGLGGVLGLGHLVGEHHLEGLLEDAGHKVPVEFPFAPLAVDAAEVVVQVLVVGVDLKAALEPQGRLDHPVDVVPVGLGHLGGAVDEGAEGGHLAVGPLHSYGDGLLRSGQKGLVEFQNGDKVRVQRGDILDLNIDVISFHIENLQSFQL